MTPVQLSAITQLRHTLHQHPELSMQETETMKILQVFLRENTSLEIHAGDGWFYALKKASASFQSSSNAGPMAFRADMDALPIAESISLPYGSENEGISHKCGHDGHCAVLCGLALELDRRETDRDVYLIFQPGEEIGAGAKRCAELIREKGIAEIYAMHNLGGYPEGTLVYRRGLTQPASKRAIIRRGRLPRLCNMHREKRYSQGTGLPPSLCLPPDCPGPIQKLQLRLMRSILPCVCARSPGSGWGTGISEYRRVKARSV